MTFNEFAALMGSEVGRTERKLRQDMAAQIQSLLDLVAEQDARIAALEGRQTSSDKRPGGGLALLTFDASEPRAGSVR